MAAVTICSDFDAQENKVSYCFYCFPSICHEVMGPDAMIFVFECFLIESLKRFLRLNEVIKVGTSPIQLASL